MPNRIWLCGDTHMHSSISDGKYTPDELISKCKTKGLDWIIISLNHLNAEEVADAGKESYGDDNYHHLGAPVFFFFRQCLLHIFTLSPFGKKPS